MKVVIYDERSFKSLRGQDQREALMTELRPFLTAFKAEYPRGPYAQNPSRTRGSKFALVDPEERAVAYAEVYISEDTACISFTELQALSTQDAMYLCKQAFLYYPNATCFEVRYGWDTNALGETIVSLECALELAQDMNLNAFTEEDVLGGSQVITSVHDVPPEDRNYGCVRMKKKDA